MGSRGPAPAPTRLKLIKGTVSPAALNAEPQPSAIQPVPPDWFDARHHAVWDGLAPDLIRRGVMTHWDVPMFSHLCALKVICEESIADIARRGNVIRGAKGMVKNPSLQILRDAQAQLLQLAGRFGLTPSDRAQIKIGAPASDRRGADRLLP